ncbi:hypothetical protein ABE527_14075 [Brucella sp. TWI432]
MSILSQALVTSFRKIVTGRTWAGQEVHEQPVDPLANVLRADGNTPSPVVAIYCDEVAGGPAGRETQSGTQGVSLHVFAYLPPAGFHVPDGSAELGSAQAGFALNLLGRQIDAAMHYGHDEWIALWRRLVPRINSKKSRFVLLEIETGERVPTLELTYELMAVEEPMFGKPLYAAWLQLDTLLRASPDGAIVAEYIKAAIEAPNDLLDYERFRANHALTYSELETTGFAPVMIKETPVLQGVNLVEQSPDRNGG